MLHAVCTQDIAAVVFLCYGFASVNRHTLYILEFCLQRLKVILTDRIENTKKFLLSFSYFSHYYLSKSLTCQTVMFA